MSRTIHISTFLLFILLALAGTTAMAKHKDGDGHTLLWRISGNGLDKPSYLFGTIDFICPGQYIWTDKMEEHYKACDRVVLSLNFSDKDLKKELLVSMANKKGEKLEDYFSAAEYKLVDQYAKDSLDVNLSHIPQFIPVTLQPFIIKKMLGCTDAVAYDVRLAGKAAADHKKVIGLETPAEQRTEIDAVHYNNKIAKTLVDMAGGHINAAFRDSLEQAYRQQDLPLLNALYKRIPLFTPEETNVLLGEKNARLAARMPATMQKAGAFIAVPATNLWGDDGIISLLRKAGYTVKPVKDK